MLTIKQISSFCQLGPRSNQEDCIAPAEPTAESRVLVLCDGMGGHGCGEVASALTAEIVAECLTPFADGGITADDIQQACDGAVDALTERFAGYGGDRLPGTTLVVAALRQKGLIIGHVGDSRAYVFGADGSLKYRSRDHSQVAEAVEQGILTEEEARQSPYRNVITRAVQAAGGHVQVEVDNVAVDEGDILLMCSDGVSDLYLDADLSDLFRLNDFDTAVARMADRCAESSRDNNTAVVALLSRSDDERDALDEAVKRFGKGFDDPGLPAPGQPPVPPVEAFIPPERRIERREFSEHSEFSESSESSESSEPAPKPTLGQRIGSVIDNCTHSIKGLFGFNRHDNNQ